MSLFLLAEDGIRDGHVTGVQTCALPIWRGVRGTGPMRLAGLARATGARAFGMDVGQSSCDTLRRARADGPRSEERRVGKGCRAGCGPGADKRTRAGMPVGRVPVVKRETL